MKRSGIKGLIKKPSIASRLCLLSMVDENWGGFDEKGAFGE